MNPFMEITADYGELLLNQHFIALVIGVALGGGIGWGAGWFLQQRLPFPDSGPHSWLRSFPLVPVLLTGALLLPMFALSPVVEGLLLMVLLIPVVFVWAVQYYGVQDVSGVQANVDKQVVLTTGWNDSAQVLVAFIVGALIYTALTPPTQESIHTYLPNLPLALLLAVAIGAGLGAALAVVRRTLTSILDRRHEREEYGQLVDNTLGGITNAIEALLTQFHGTPLAAVLAILAAVLPFSQVDQGLGLVVLLFPPAASALLAALMVEDPGPDEIGFWSHLRTGVFNLAMIVIGYVIGATALYPLEIVHAWTLDQPDQVSEALITHLDLTFTSLLYSMLLGIGGGIIASRVDFLRVLLTNLGNIGRTIPSLAVLALALPLFGVGRAPSLIALVFIGTLPILVNTSVGIIEVSENIKEAARGMGMNNLQVLLRVEVPIAIPVIMAGVRTSAVLIVASATLAGFVGGGGLGALIIRGDGSGRDDILFTGAVLSTILAIFLEYLFGWLETLLTPRGLRLN